MATRPQLMLHLGLCFLSCRYYTSTATRERDHVPANSESLLSSYYISLGLGKGKLSFKLTNLSSHFSRACSGPTLYPIFFLDHCRFCALVLSNSFSRSFQVLLLPLMVAILAPTEHASAEEFPLYSSPYSCNQEEQMLVHWEDWKASLFSLFRAGEGS